jgi:hypothetical protein
MPQSEIVMKRSLPWVLTAFAILLAPVEALSQSLEGPAEGSARVYFFRFLGPASPERAAPVELFDGHSYLGSIRSSHYYGVDLEPGKHLLWSKVANQKWFLHADLEADRVYYVHLHLIPPTWAGPSRPALSPACSRGKGKKTLKRITQRLQNEKFSKQDALPPEDLARREADLKPVIEEIMGIWESDWSKEKRWESLLKSDYVD